MTCDVSKGMSNFIEQFENQVDQNSGKHGHRSAVRLLAPDEIEVGQYVVTMSSDYEIPTYMWPGLDHLVYPIEKPVKIRLVPYCCDMPEKVSAICYPFVLCEDKNGVKSMVDLRITRLGQVSAKFAEIAGKTSQRKESSKKRKGKKKKNRKN